MSCGFFPDYPNYLWPQLFSSKQLDWQGVIHLVQNIFCFICGVLILPQNVDPWWETLCGARHRDSEINLKRGKFQALWSAPLQACQNSSEQHRQVSSKPTRASTFSKPCSWDITHLLHVFSGRHSCLNENYFRCSDPGSDWCNTSVNTGDGAATSISNASAQESVADVVEDLTGEGHDNLNPNPLNTLGSLDTNNRPQQVHKFQFH